MKARDHGGGIDAAAARFGGTRDQWLDLSTGINPVPYPLPDLPAGAWTALPDTAAQTALTDAARRFWGLPKGAAIVAAPGTSALIARIPYLAPPGRVAIQTPTYNEHAAAFAAARWEVIETIAAPGASATVLVNPNNPTGAWRDWPSGPFRLTIIDESFADIDPTRSLIQRATTPGTIVLKGLGKFWGLAGLRLGFAMGDPRLIEKLTGLLGPWAVSGPALAIGTAALQDFDWAHRTRDRLTADADRLDAIATAAGATVAGGTPLFRLYSVRDAAGLRGRLAHHRIWTRVFPWSASLIRVGLPGPDDWPRVERAWTS